MLKKKVKNALKYVFLHAYTRLYRIKRQVLFISFHGNQYSDNPKAISERLHEKYPHIQIAWYTSNLEDPILPEYVIRYCPQNDGRFALVKAIASSACFVTNYELGEDTVKKKKQMFIQSYHGDVGPKKVLYDAWENGNRPNRIMDDRLTDFCVSGSDNGDRTYRSGFKYHGKIFKVGMPRNDCLIKQDSERISKIKKFLQIGTNKKILLYAPTFRDNNDGIQHIAINLYEVLTSLESSGEEWICLIRAHSASKGLDIKCDGKKFINVSVYPDMADLLLVSDMLITDYSSCAGDFLLKRKPVILALFDKNEYLSECREMYYDPEKVGFISAHNQKELIHIINSIDDEEYSENCEKLIRYFNIVDSGNAADIISEEINNHIIKIFDNSGK